MKKVIFEKLNFINLIPIILFRIIGYEIFYIKIEKYLQKLIFINLLKKIKIYWFNYQDYNLNGIETLQMKSYLSYAEIISNTIANKFCNKSIAEKFFNEDFFKGSIEFNLKNKIFSAIEIAEIYKFLKYQNIDIKCYVWSDNSFVNNFIFKRYIIKNININKFQFLELFPTFLFYFIKLSKFFFIQGKPAVSASETSDEKLNKTKTVYFPHDILTSGLYIKDFFYSNKKDHPFYPSNILHIEWNKSYLPERNKKHYKDKNINYLIWQDLYQQKSFKNLINYIFNKRSLFIKLLFWDYDIFKIICSSIFKINKSDLFCQKYPEIKYILSGHNDLFPPEILITAKKRKIISISLEDRLLTSFWSSRVLFEVFFSSGPLSKKNIQKKIFKNINNTIAEGFLIKSLNIKNNQFIKKNHNFQCLVSDFHTDRHWYSNGINKINNQRLNKDFYEQVLRLALKFDNIDFLIKSKSYEWVDQHYLSKTVHKINETSNVKILKNQEKWTPKFTADFCHFSFGLHSSLMDEMFAANKPIIIYTPHLYPTKILNYGVELTASTLNDAVEKIKKLTNNYDEYNKNLDKKRSLLFYKNNENKISNQIDNILKL